MCGIVGFTGNRQAAPILLDGLSKLEYRGYDSAGLAVRDGEALAQVVKAKGRLSNLIEKTDNGNALKGTCGIGHTRWATHGEPSQTNAHPYVSGNCSRSGSCTVESEVVGVHNGIIENYTELKLFLADIIELLPTPEQESDLRNLMGWSSESYRFATAEEMISLGIDTNSGDLRETIADHTTKIIQENEGKLIKNKSVGKIYSVTV